MSVHLYNRLCSVKSVGYDIIVLVTTFLKLRKDL